LSKSNKKLKNKKKKNYKISHILRPLREVWMKVGLEKINKYEGVVVEALLDTRVTRLFID